MRLNLGVASLAIYLGGVQDLLNLRLVNKDMSTCCRKSVVTDMIGKNWRRMVQHLSSLPVDPRFRGSRNFSSRKAFPIDPQELSNLLKSHDCIVAGPFALQCVTGDECGVGSIQGEMHLYCTTSGKEAMAAYFTRHGYVHDAGIAYSPSQCAFLSMSRNGHEIVLIDLCDKQPPRGALALFEGQPGLMTLHEGSIVHYWFRDNDAKPCIVFCNTVAPLCYALIM